MAESAYYHFCIGIRTTHQLSFTTLMARLYKIREAERRAQDNTNVKSRMLTHTELRFKTLLGTGFLNNSITSGEELDAGGGGMAGVG